MKKLLEINPLQLFYAMYRVNPLVFGIFAALIVGAIRHMMGDASLDKGMAGQELVFVYAAPTAGITLYYFSRGRRIKETMADGQAKFVAWRHRKHKNDN